MNHLFSVRIIVLTLKRLGGGGLVCPLPTLKLLYLEKSPHFPKNVLPDFLGAA